MLNRFDRIQVSSPNRIETADAWRRLVDARVVREDQVRALAASRTVLRVGTSEVEVLEPDGAGPVADHLRRTRGGVFAAGLATRDLGALRAHLESAGVSLVALDEEGRQLMADAEALGIPGLRVVLSEYEEREAEGLLRHLYEVTHLVPDAVSATARIADVFGLDSSHFVPIKSDAYGYDGSLTLFDPARLDRIETIYPEDQEKTMGRFFQRFGPSLYMSYAECDDVGALRDRLLKHAPDDWTGRREGVSDGLFIHPKALGGVMLGVSRTTYAWTWSGNPDRVQPAP